MRKVRGEVQQDFWCNLKDVFFVWNGNGLEPEIAYKNHVVDEMELYSELYGKYLEDIEDGKWVPHKGDFYSDVEVSYIEDNEKYIKNFILETGEYRRPEKDWYKQIKVLNSKLRKRRRK